MGAVPSPALHPVSLGRSAGTTLAMRRGRLVALIGSAVFTALLAAGPAQARAVQVGEYRLPAANLAKLQTDWVDQLTSRYGTHAWAPMRFNLHDRDLRLMGLPPKRVLLAH